MTGRLSAHPLETPLDLPLPPKACSVGVRYCLKNLFLEREGLSSCLSMKVCFRWCGTKLLLRTAVVSVLRGWSASIRVSYSMYEQFVARSGEIPLPAGGICHVLGPVVA